MNLDMAVLIGSLLAILLSVVWTRATIVGPVLFAWAGAAVGGTVAFLLFYNKAHDRVDIGHIIPLAVFGAACGLLPGFAVRAAYLRADGRHKASLEVIAGAVFFAGLGLVVGWNVHRLDSDVFSSVLGFATFFAVIGAALALVNWHFRSRRRDAV